MVALVEDEDLGLVREPAESGGMDDAVAVAAENVARGLAGSGVEPAAAAGRIGRIGRARTAASIAMPSVHLFAKPLTKARRNT